MCALCVLIVLPQRSSHRVNAKSTCKKWGCVSHMHHMPEERNVTRLDYWSRQSTSLQRSSPQKITLGSPSSTGEQAKFYF